ncbi:MAG: PH domain-containing protein, partial [Proteobacteria bacterium]|nr:PH domain-containing protein [Pseudomonadota bacterium]
MRTRFRLAPMSTGMRIMTGIGLVIPIIFAVQIWFSPPAIRILLGSVAALIIVMYAGIWLAMRPSAFVVDADDLELVWPVRRRRVARRDIVRVRKLVMADLKQEIGYLLRVGAGGLWGGFGLAKTARGTMELWVSRADWIVWIECRDRRSLLVTPDDPDRFVALLAPATSGPAADMLVKVERFSLDWWFLWPVALTDRLGGGLLWLCFLGAG